MYQKEKEDTIVQVAYNMAEKLYYVNILKMKDLSIDVDDFKQEAVMHILNLYRDDYISLDEDYKPEGMIYTLLKQFHQNYLTRKIREKNKKGNSLNTKQYIPNEGIQEKQDFVSEKSLMNPEQYSIYSFEKERTEKIFENIINEFDVVPFRTRKYLYIGKDQKTFSEYNLAKLILKGYNVEKILKEYNVYTHNIGTSSKASLVNRKIKQVVEKLSQIVSKLDEDDRKAIAFYVKSL